MSLPAEHAARPADLGLTPQSHGIYQLLVTNSGRAIDRRHVIRGSGRSVLSDQVLTRMISAVQRSTGRARVRAVPGRGWKFTPALPS